MLTRALWTHGANFYAPHVAVLRRRAHADGEGDASSLEEGRRSGVAAWTPGTSARRTVREWCAFVGRKAGGKWTRRARLGLSPRAAHEERYAKYADELASYGW